MILRKMMMSFEMEFSLKQEKVRSQYVQREQKRLLMELRKCQGRN